MILWRQMRNGNNRFYDLHDNRAVRNDDTLKTDELKVGSTVLVADDMAKLKERKVASNERNRNYTKWVQEARTCPSMARRAGE